MRTDKPTRDRKRNKTSRERNALTRAPRPRTEASGVLPDDAVRALHGTQKHQAATAVSPITKGGGGRGHHVARTGDRMGGMYVGGGGACGRRAAGILVKDSAKGHTPVEVLGDLALRDLPFARRGELPTLVGTPRAVIRDGVARPCRTRGLHLDRSDLVCRENDGIFTSGKSIKGAQQK